MGWRRGCLAAGLVRISVRHYCLGGCSALFVCAGRSRQVRQGGAVPVLLALPLWVSPFPRGPSGACCGLCCLGNAFRRLLVRHSMQSMDSANSVRLPFRSALPARCLCLRSCPQGVRNPPSGQSGAHIARSTFGGRP